MKPQEIEWENRICIGAGGFAVVYRVADGVVAKVGPYIEPEEVEEQRYFADMGKALPVYGYMERMDVPEIVAEECCPFHGYRSDIVLSESWDCTCGEKCSVLTMPEAEPAYQDYYTPEGRAFMNRIVDLAWEHDGYAYDARPANLAKWKGAYVALDFGEQ